MSIAGIDNSSSLTAFSTAITANDGNVIVVAVASSDISRSCTEPGYSQTFTAYISTTALPAFNSIKQMHSVVGALSYETIVGATDGASTFVFAVELATLDSSCNQVFRAILTFYSHDNGATWTSSSAPSTPMVLAFLRSISFSLTPLFHGYLYFIVSSLSGWSLIHRIEIRSCLVLLLLLSTVSSRNFINLFISSL